ncbi:MAG: hypothetical protein AAGB03_01705 [Pseudomonadota bacterium]
MADSRRDDWRDRLDPGVIGRFANTGDGLGQAPKSFDPLAASPTKHGSRGNAALIITCGIGLTLLWAGTVLAFATGYVGAIGLSALPNVFWIMVAACVLTPSAFIGASTVLLLQAFAQKRATARLDEATARLLRPETVVEGQMQRLVDRLRGQIGDLAGLADGAFERISDMQEALHQQGEDMRRVSTETQDKISETRDILEKERDAITRLTLDVRAGAEKIAGHIVEQAMTLSRASEEALDGFSSLGDQIEGQTTRLSRLTDDMANRAQTVSTEIEQGLERLEIVSQSALTKADMVGDRYKDHSESIAGTGARLSDQSDLVEKRLRDLTGLIETFEVQTVERLDERQAKLEGALKALGEAVHAIEDQLSTATQQLKTEASSLAEAGESTAGTMLRAAETAQAFEREARKSMAKLAKARPDEATDRTKAQPVSQPAPTNGKVRAGRKSPHNLPNEKPADDVTIPNQPTTLRTKASPAPPQGPASSMESPPQAEREGPEKPNDDVSARALSDWIDKRGKKSQLRRSPPRERPVTDEEAFEEVVREDEEGSPGLDIPEKASEGMRAGGARAGSVRPKQLRAGTLDGPGEPGRRAPRNGLSSSKAPTPNPDREELGWKEILAAAETPFDTDGPQGGSEDRQNGQSPGYRILSHRAGQLSQLLKEAGHETGQIMQNVQPLPLYSRFIAGQPINLGSHLLTDKGNEASHWAKDRYWEDDEFRILVDRYLTDYEAVLARLADQAEDDREIDTFMKEDTGKLYFLLGEATDRFA